MRDLLTRHGIWSRTRFERDLDDELRFHIEMEAKQHRRRGMTLADARRAALREFGGVDRVKEEVRTARGVGLLTDLAADLRVAIRVHLRRPGLTAAVVATLAVGLGAAIAVFSALDRVVLRPLPYPSSHQLVTVWAAFRGGHAFGLTAPELLDLRAESRTVMQLAGYVTGEPAVRIGDYPERVQATWVTDGFFETLHTAPAIGTPLTPAHYAPHAPRVVVLSHGFWRDRFGGDRSVVGRSISVGGEPATVVGVMPRPFAFPDGNVAFWTPHALDPLRLRPGDRYLSVLARLRPSLDAAHTTDELNELAYEMAVRHAQRFPQGANTLVTPGTRSGSAVSLVPLRRHLIGPAARALWLLTAAVGSVLVIACATVAGVTLARGEERRGEIVARAALGATPGRLLRQVLAESVLLALVGGGIGLLIAYGALAAAPAIAPIDLPTGVPLALDVRIAAAGMALALLAGLGFGLAPGLRAAGVVAAPPATRGGGRVTTANLQRLFRVLVTTQVAVAVVLVSAAGVLRRSLGALIDIDPGFRTSGRLVFHLEAPTDRYPDVAAVNGLFDDIANRVRGLPGVGAAGFVDAAPLSGTGSETSLAIEGVDVPFGEPLPVADLRVVSPGYFAAAGIRALRGRVLETADRREPVASVLVSASAARAYWPEADPVGARIRFHPAQRWVRVVGVVTDVRHRSVGVEPRPTVYLPQSTVPLSGGLIPRQMSMVVDAGNHLLDVAPRIRGIVGEVDGAIAVSGLEPLADVVSRSLGSLRLVAVLLSAFAAIAVLIAVVGTYGVVSYAASRRRREIGIRLAVGADRGAVVRLFLRESVWFAGLGLVAGLSATAALGGLVRRYIYDARVADSLILGGVAAGLGAVVVIATLIPALRSAHLDPSEVLRSDA